MPGTADYDVLIVGGGMIGASLACALAATPLRVALVEAVPFGAPAQPSYDDRSIALGFGTRRIFEGMGLWPALAERITPIRAIHISDRGHFGITRLRCEDEGLEAMGYVAETRAVGEVLSQELAALAGVVDLFCPAVVASVRDGAVALRVALAGGAELTAKLVIAADGVGSAVRDMLGIAVQRTDYRQHAVIANVTPERGHGNVAYERFTETGPIALLPMGEGRCALVWAQREEDVEAVLALDDARFLARLQERFGWRLGRFLRTGARRAYPLALVRAQDALRPRVAVIGNAAHTLHPIAGQGFNLGLRDVAVLADVLSEAAARGEDVGEYAVLRRYADWRRADQRRVIALTDGLARLFAQPSAPFVLARNLAMLAIDLLPPLKSALARQGMGLVGRLPRLARGLSLEAGARRLPAGEAPG
jgi:2-octaprenyl-6-methoxyphenol hydroxylase